MNLRLGVFIVCFMLVAELLVGCDTLVYTDEILSESNCYNTRSLCEDEDFDVHLLAVKRFVELSYPCQSYRIQPLAVDTDTLLFVCNFDDGWIVVSGDKRTSPVLAEDSVGQLNLKDAPDGLFVWLDSIAEDVWYLKRDAPKIINKNVEFWDLIFCPISQYIPTKSGRSFKWYVVDSSPVVSTTGYSFVPHLISTKWGQGSPWNSKCPIDTKVNKRCYLGCVATAVAQMLIYTHTFLSKPNRLYHNISCSKTTVYGNSYNIGFSRSNLVENSTRWLSMPIDSTGVSTSIAYAGDLMLDIGNRFGMYYSGSGSGADISSSAMLNYYDLSYTYGDYNMIDVADNVGNDLPVIISAYSERGFLGIGYSRGHEWLIDGIYLSTTSYTYTKSFVYSEDWAGHSEVYDTFEEIQAIYGVQYPSDTVERTVSINTTYWLMNWGYNGNYDSGHYGMAVTDEWNANGGSHQYNRKIYYDFS